MADVEFKRLIEDAIAGIINPDTVRVARMVYQWNTGGRWIGMTLEKFKLRSMNKHREGGCK